MNFKPVTCAVLTLSTLTFLPLSWSGAATQKALSPKTGTIGIRLVPIGGASSNTPLTHSYIVDRLAPGTSLVRTVEIDNDTDAFVKLSVYVSAAHVDRGNFAFSPAATQNSLSSWTSLSIAALQLAPHSQKFDTVRIKAPRDAASGEHYAVVWAAMSTSPKGGRGITLVSRVGVRMYVAIGRGGTAAPNFTLGALHATRSGSGKLQLVAALHNSGKNTLALSGLLTLSHGPNGLHAGPLTATMGALLSPGSTESVTIPFASSFPRGPWSARLVVSSGLLQHSTRDSITFPPRYAARLASHKNGFLVPLIVLLACLITAALFATARSLRRGRVRPVRAPLTIQSFKFH